MRVSSRRLTGRRTGTPHRKASSHSRRSVAVIAAGVLAASFLTAASAPAAGPPVVIANAGVLGSLVTFLKTAGPGGSGAGGTTITSQTGGSVALAQGIEGTPGVTPVTADIFGSADSSVNSFLLGDANKNKERWFAAFARNAIVMQYSPSASNPHAADFAKAAAGTEPWYQPLITGPQPINLCRTSPDADPSGYYNLFIMQLAERKYPSVASQLAQVLGSPNNPAQMAPTCSAGGKSLANGGLDINFTYLSSAFGGSTPYIVLPDDINLGDPDFVDNYAKASYKNSAGQTFHGGVIRPSIAPIDGSANPDAATSVPAVRLPEPGEPALDLPLPLE